MKRFVSKTLNEYLEVNPAGGVEGDANFVMTFEEMIQIIENTADREFTVQDFKNFGDFLIENVADPSHVVAFLKHLFGVHPSLQQDFMDPDGPVRAEIDRIMSAYDPENPMNRGRARGPIDPRMN